MMKKCAPKARPENFGVFGSGQIQISWLGSLNKGGFSTGIRTDCRFFYFPKTESYPSVRDQS